MLSWLQKFSDRARLGRQTGWCAGPTLAVMVCVAICAAPGQAKDNGYEVSHQDQVVLVTGESGSLSLSIRGTDKRTISKDGPVTIALTSSSSGLALAKSRFGRADSADPAAERPRFDLPLLGKEKGRYRLTIVTKFWLCRRRTCVPIRHESGVDVQVETAPPAPPAERTR